MSNEVSVQSVLNPTQAPPPHTSATRETASLELPFKAAKERLVDGFTLEYLTALHQKYAGNVTQMARASGLARTYLHELLARYGLRGD